MKNKLTDYTQLRLSKSRHSGILDVLKDFEQLMSAPYDAEYLVNWIETTRNFHASSWKQIDNKLKELDK